MNPWTSLVYKLGNCGLVDELTENLLYNPQMHAAVGWRIRSISKEIAREEEER